MAKQKEELEQMTTTRSKRSHKFLWMVEDKKDAEGRRLKSFWTKIGVAFENRDGSYSIDLAAIPVSGKLQMRDPKVLEPSPI